MQTKLVKENAVNLYGLIRDIKNSNLSREALVKYIMLRVKLKSLFDDYEKAREEISALSITCKNKYAENNICSVTGCELKGASLGTYKPK